MLNENKMKMLTGIAMFEKREGKRIFPAVRYFRGDYITGRLLRAFFSYTFCCVLCAAVWVLYSSEELLSSISFDNMVLLARAGAVLYVVGLILYLLVAARVSAARYEYARRGMEVYRSRLRRLERRYYGQDTGAAGKGGTAQ